MKDQLLACLNANYEKSFQKAEALHKFLQKLILANIPIAEKMQYLFVPQNPDDDIRPLYSHLKELRSKKHPIQTTLEDFLTNLLEYYQNDPKAQSDLIALDTMSFQILMFAKISDETMMLTKFFDQKTAAKFLQEKKIHPQLIFRIMTECFYDAKNKVINELKIISHNVDWLAIVAALSKSLSEPQLYALQFLHNQAFLDHLNDVPGYPVRATLGNSSHVTLSADWLSNPVLAIPRISESNGYGWQTIATLLRYGKQQQVLTLLTTLEKHLANVVDKNAYLQDLLLRKTHKNPSALCQADAMENGVVLMGNIFSWLEKKYIGKEFVKALLETDFISHLIEASPKLSDKIIVLFLEKLADWVKMQWITSDELKTFLQKNQDSVMVQVDDHSNNPDYEVKRIFFLDLAVRTECQTAFIRLLNLLEQWVQANILTKDNFLEILSSRFIDLTKPPKQAAALKALGYHPQSLSPINVLLKRSANLNDLLGKLHHWMQIGILSKQQLEDFLLPPENKYAITRSLRNDPKSTTSFWQWAFRCYAEGKISLTTLVTLFVGEQGKSLHHHFLCDKEVYNSEFQQQLIQQMYCLLTLDVTPAIEQQIDPTQWTQLQSILKYATTANPFEYEDWEDGKLQKSVLHPNQSRVLFYIALGFSDADILKQVKKQEIFSVIMALSEKELPMQIKLLRAANDPNQPLGRFFRLPENVVSKISSRFFRADEWGRRLQEALQVAIAQYMPDKKKSSNTEFLPSTNSSKPQQVTAEFSPSAVASTSSSTSSSSSSSEKPLILPDVPLDELPDLEFEDADSDTEEPAKQAVVGR